MSYKDPLSNVISIIKSSPGIPDSKSLSFSSNILSSSALISPLTKAVSTLFPFNSNNLISPERDPMSCSTVNVLSPPSYESSITISTRIKLVVEIFETAKVCPLTVASVKLILDGLSMVNSITTVSPSVTFSVLMTLVSKTAI